MEQFSFDSLHQLLIVDGSKNVSHSPHSLFAYHANLHQFLISSDSMDSSVLLHLLTQLNLQIDFLHDDKNRELLENLVTQQTRVAIAQNYTRLLLLNKAKLYDTTDKFVNIFAASDANNKKKLTAYTPLKELAVVILTFIYENFGHGVTSFISLLVLSILRTLKRFPDNISSYAINLSQLLFTVLNNCGDHTIFIDDSFINRYNKLLKNLLDQQHPSSQIILISNLYKSFPFFVKLNPKPDSNHFQLNLKPNLISGLRNPEKLIRISSAKALAELFVLLEYNLKRTFKMFIEMYIDGDNFIKIGIMESINHLVSLNFAKDYESINSQFIEILDLLLSFFNHERILNSNSNEISKILNHIDDIFATLLRFIGDSNQRILFEKLFKSYLTIDDERKLNHLKVKPVLRIVERILDNLSNLSESDLEASQIVLLKLAVSSNFQVRIQTVEVLTKFASNFPQLIKSLMENAFNELSNNFNQSSDKTLHFVKSHGLALILSKLFGIADKDYVPIELVEQILDLIIPFLKYSSNFRDNTSYFKLLTSWVVLIGAYNYNDLSVFESRIDQILAVSTNDNYVLLSSKTTSTSDIQRIIDIDIHSLTAGLNYLQNLKEIDDHTVKWFSKLLERELKIINQLHDVRMRTKDLDSLLCLLEKRILQIYVKIIPIIKQDFNSLVVIQTIKNFADLQTFDIKSKDASQSSNGHNTTSNEILETDEDQYFSGLTSKFNGFEIDELAVKFHKRENSPYKQNSSLDSAEFSKDLIESGLFISDPLANSFWFDQLEQQSINPISNSLDEDYFSILYQESYSLKRLYSVNSKTAIIDLSIEIFALVFPSLTKKVQLSLIENLRTFILTKTLSDKIQIATVINSSIAIHGLLSVLNKDENLTMDQSVCIFLLETLRNIYEIYPSQFSLKLNSDSVGIIVSQLSPNSSDEQIQILIRKILDNESSQQRTFNALTLGNIYKYTSSKSTFSDIFQILEKLSSDLHPNVHSVSLLSLSVLIDNHVAINQSIAIKLLEAMEFLLISDNYGTFNRDASSSDINVSKLESNKALSKLLRSVISSLGPTIKDLDSDHKQVITNLTSGLLFYNVDYLNNAFIQQELIKLIQELIIFDPESFSLKTLIDILGFIIPNNLMKSIGSNFTLNLYDEQNEIFPMSSSLNLLQSAIECLYQLVKTVDDKKFLSKLEPFVWICLELFPHSIIIEKIIQEWLTSTYDISWFNKLSKLFNLPKKRLYSVISKNYTLILDKYKQKKVEVDVNDEEAQSIAHKYEKRDGDENDDEFDDDSKSGETVNWRFKLSVLRYLRQLLSYTQRDSRLFDQLSSRVSELIKISFSASTSAVIDLRLAGIDLLGDIVVTYASTKDPIYPELSLLEQQQAQITSALVPAFQHDSTPILASKAINVAATFIGSRVVKINRLGRISKILIDSLEDLQKSEENKGGNEDFKLHEVHITSKRGQRRVKLSILNAWAELKALAQKNNDTELNQLVSEHLDLLLPLWIATLKEFAVFKNDQTKPKDDDLGDLYDVCWINFVEAVGCITEENDAHFFELLSHDSYGFFYMLFSQSIHFLMTSSSVEKSEQRIKILESFHKILGFKGLVKLILQDDVFDESVDYLERLMITGDVSEQLILLDIISRIFLDYFDSGLNDEEDLSSNVDKLFELVSVNVQCVVNVLPFVRDSSSDADYPVKKTKELSHDDLQLLKKALTSISTMISRFPDMIEIDLYSSLLSIILSVYQVEAFDLKNQIIPIIIPNLKSILVQLVKMNDTVLVNKFFRSINLSLKTSVSKVNSLLTLGVVLNSSHELLALNLNEVSVIANILVDGLIDEDTVAISAQAIKSIIVSNSITNHLLLKKIIPLLITRIILADGEHTDPRLAIELIVLTAKHQDEDDKTLALYTVLITTLVQKYEDDHHLGGYLNKKLISLVQLNSKISKVVINEILTAKQRETAEIIVKLGNTEESKNENEHQHIKLKTFDV